MDNKEIIIIDEKSLKDKIYIIRDQQVMLDSDLAVYFNVETKALNRSMKRNIERFPESFCFILAHDEYKEILRCQFGTLELEQGKYSKYLPYVYTEQGIAMLTSCLHTKEAIMASIEIINAFVEMRHCLYQNKFLPSYRDLYLLSSRQDTIETDVKEIKETMVNKKVISNLLKLFNEEISNEEILMLNGQPFKADLAYQRIFKKAKKSIFIIDDYIDIKLLELLRDIKVNTIIFSDNKNRHLTNKELCDFNRQYPNVLFSFKKTNNTIHDRFIIIDYHTKNEVVYHLGSSIKDSGNRLTVINKFENTSLINQVIKEMLENEELII